MKGSTVIFCCALELVIVSVWANRPHIVFIVADDLGWNDFGIHGSSQIPTPNIDALAYNGAILDKYYTQHTCTPSRVALLTGNYPIRTGLQGIPLDPGENRSLPLNMPTMAERFKELGYKTHMVGKWHLGAACKEVTPTRRGFDSHFGYFGGYVGYFDYELSVVINVTHNLSGFDLHDGLKTQWEYKGQYATELFTEKSLKVIEEHDKNEPLFLIVNHLAGHTGRQGIELGVPDPAEANAKYGYIKSPERRLLADIVNRLDTSVGEIVEKLSEKGMLENSIIIFFSDNGAQTQGMFQNFASGWPFRGMKFTLFEGGVRGTGIIYSPLMKKKRYVNRHLIHITDWLPTLYHAAGGQVKKLGKIDGINQWNTISGNEATNRAEILLNIDEVNGYSGILGYDGRYKLLNGSWKNGSYNGYYGDDGRGPENPAYNIQLVLDSPTNIAIQKFEGESIQRKQIEMIRAEVDRAQYKPTEIEEVYLCENYCLFDINADPSETKNLIADEDKREIVENLKQKLKGFRSSKDFVPQTSKKVDPNSDPARFNNTWYPWLDCGHRHIEMSLLQRMKKVFWKFINAKLF